MRAITTKIKWNAKGRKFQLALRHVLGKVADENCTKKPKSGINIETTKYTFTKRSDGSFHVILTNRTENQLTRLKEAYSIIIVGHIFPSFVISDK